MSEEKVIMPVIPIWGVTMLPGMMIHFDIYRPRSVQAINMALREGRQIFVVTQRNVVIDDPRLKDLFEMGTISQVKQIIKMPGNQTRVLATGIRRGHLEEILSTAPYVEGVISLPTEVNADQLPVAEQKAMLRTLKEMLGIYAGMEDKLGKDVLKQLMGVEAVDSFINQMAVSIPLGLLEQQQILATAHIKERFAVVTGILGNEIEIARIKKELQNKVKDRIEKNHKDYIIREQLKVIRAELGEGNAVEDAEEFYRRLQTLDVSPEIGEKIKKEIDRFRAISTSQAEGAVARGYVETLLALPWNKATKDRLSIMRAEKILNRDHYGLLKVKERILEFLAVRTLNEKGQAPIICLVGPPGTGKTSIARSVATALGRKYVRICLGGVRDEAEIRGHRRTYVGAMPGRLIQGLKAAGVKNPLILLDEIDKVSSDYKGDTSSALLEVLDPEQNRNFVDHYVEIPVDLSEVLFICTANSAQNIPKPLLDRMELIEVNSYTEEEKFHIAKDFLVPKQLKQNGLTKKEVVIQPDVLRDVIFFYTKEAGVRSLERKIGELYRKAAKKVLEAKQKKENLDTIKITRKNLEEYLGKKKYHRNSIDRTAEIGVVRGLAWTEAGGDMLRVEVNCMPGKGKLVLTGKLGEVMKESAQIALSYVRSIVQLPQEQEDYFEKHDFHLHVPEGSVPKDGPSAGITMATAFYSIVMGCPVRAEVAMTGEISLRGRVLPIGGLKEKLLAAKQADMKKVLIPKENENDLAEISEDSLSGIEVVSVSNMEEVLSHAVK